MNATDKCQYDSQQLSRNRRFEKHSTVARFALSSAVLPSVTEALPVAEMARFALSSLRADETYSLALAGKAEGEGVPLKEDHAHAHFWATDEDEDRRLDHLTVYAPRGFDADDVDALGRVRVVKRHYKNLPDVRLVLLDLGTRDDFAHVPAFRVAKRWRSVTPFHCHALRIVAAASLRVRAICQRRSCGASCACAGCPNPFR